MKGGLRGWDWIGLDRVGGLWGGGLRFFVDIYFTLLSLILLFYSSLFLRAWLGLGVDRIG